MEPLEIFFIIIGLIISVLLALIPYFRKTYFIGPELSIELIPDGGTSMQRGLSHKNDRSKTIPVDEAIYVFEVEWNINLKITNNSELTAYYPEIIFHEDKIGFTKLDKLNKNNPIKPNEIIHLNGSYTITEECKGSVRTHINRQLPAQLNDLKILLEYKNPSKKTFYTLYNNSDTKEKNRYFRKKPKEFKK